MTDVALENSLRARFNLREDAFAHGRHQWRLLRPADAEVLIDEEAFEADERLPYWADLWPAARGLARHLLDHPPREPRAIELGCGVGLVSLALAVNRISVLATDYEDAALEFAAANAARNALPGVTTSRLDWRAIPEEFTRFDLVVGADVLYEARLVDVVAKALGRLVAEGGRAIVAGPGRRHEAALPTLLEGLGWSARLIDSRIESQPNAAESTISIHELRPPATH